MIDFIYIHSRLKRLICSGDYNDGHYNNVNDLFIYFYLFQLVVKSSDVIVYVETRA